MTNVSNIEKVLNDTLPLTMLCAAAEREFENAPARIRAMKQYGNETAEQMQRRKDRALKTAAICERLIDGDASEFTERLKKEFNAVPEPVRKDNGDIEGFATRKLLDGHFYDIAQVIQDLAVRVTRDLLYSEEVEQGMAARAQTTEVVASEVGRTDEFDDFAEDLAIEEGGQLSWNESMRGSYTLAQRIEGWEAYFPRLSKLHFVVQSPIQYQPNGARIMHMFALSRGEDQARTFHQAFDFETAREYYHEAAAIQAERQYAAVKTNNDDAFDAAIA